MDYTEQRVDGEIKYKGVIVTVRLDSAKLHNGKIVKREVVEHPGGVTILPVDGDGNCYMVRQFRYPFGHMMLEAPAGKLEYGEDHRDCALRELSEETGFTADELVYLGACCTSPGFSTEVLHIYLALGLHAGDRHPEFSVVTPEVPFPAGMTVGEHGALSVPTRTGMDGFFLCAMQKAQ